MNDMNNTSTNIDEFDKNTLVKTERHRVTFCVEPVKNIPFQSVININNNNTNEQLSSEVESNKKTGEHVENLYDSRNFLSRYIQDYSAIPQDKSQKQAKLGVVLGVLLPCIQNIFGVIFFIRISWVVGNSGLLQGFFIAFICCACTFLTSISLSAVATNGAIKSGGPYFIISRSLSAAFGGSIGLLFYIGNTIAVSMYVCGACEIFLKYMFQNRVSLVGDMTQSTNFFWNVRIYGTIWLIILSVLVLLGVKFVSKVSPIFLCCVLLSILGVFIGIIKSAFVPIDLNMCVLGGRLLTSQSQLYTNGIKFCTKDKYCTYGNQSFICPLYSLYCGGNKFNATDDKCDLFWNQSKIEIRKAFPGFKAAKDNIFSGYLSVGDSNPNEKGDLSKGQVIEQDTSTSFLILIGIFFPSVTGILAGCNRSGDLKNPSSSIPKGTITAQLLTSVIYILALLGYGMTTDRLALRDKSGLGIDNKLVSANLAWPHEWFVLIGSFFSTSGAGLQSLTSAPRLLQAIAKDDVIPFLSFFSANIRGEPIRALLFTFCIAELGVLIADIDKLTPLVAMFFLLCYTFINFACSLHSLIDAPNWRPRFIYYHWSLAVIGTLLCLSVMFIIQVFYACIAWVMAILLYVYIKYKGAEKEWGEGLKGLDLSAARYAILNLEDKPEHTKNWRPQLLLCVNLKDEKATRPELFDFAKQLTRGKGLTMSVNVVENDIINATNEVKQMKDVLKQIINNYNLNGCIYTTASKTVEIGLSYIIQTAGIGPVRPNTVLMGWPKHETSNKEKLKNFINLIHTAHLTEKAVILMKSNNYPMRKCIQEGTIDLWFIIDDGGLMLQLGYLLKLNRIWKKCKLRLFTVAQITDNSIQIKNNLESYLHMLRIDASVKVVEMTNNEISAYAYEKTIRILKRSELFKTLNIPFEPLESLVSSKDESQSKSMSGTDVDNPQEKSTFTYTPATWRAYKNRLATTSQPNEKTAVRKMHSAVELNKHLRNESSKARLLIINLPTPPQMDNELRIQNYVHYIEALTEGLDRVLLVRGSQKEVLTFLH